MSSADVNHRRYASWPHPLQNAQIRLDGVPLRGLTVRALRFAYKTEPSEVGGLLWGTVLSDSGSKTILVEQAEFIGTDGILFNTSETTFERLNAALARPRSNLQPLGFFRSAIRGDVFPREQDRVFVEGKLLGPDSFVLIIEPLLTGGLTAHFYFGQGGRLQMKASLLRVPLTPQSSDEHDVSEAAQAPVAALRNQEPLVPEDYHFAVHDEGGFSAPPSWGKGRTFFIVALLLAMAGVSIYRIMSQRSPSPQFETQAADTPIGLQVERRRDGQLDLTWNRKFARSANADRAQLSITDGTYVRTLSLTEDQLLSGKLAYFPRSADIRFRLEISVGRNRTIGESIRVVSPEVYASSFPDSASRPMRVRTETARVMAPDGGNARETATLKALPLNDGASIVKTDTPGTYILTSRPSSIPARANNENTDESSGAQRPATVIQPVPEPVITAVPPPLSTYSTKQGPSTRLAAAIAVPQSPSIVPPPAPSPLHPQASEPDRPDGEPPLSSTAAPVAVPPRPVYQVMPNTKPFGYSLVNNDMQVDIEVQIDENGVVRQASPAAGSGRGTMLTTQALIAAKKWRFKPAEVDGRKVPGTYIINFKFRRAP